MEAKGAINGYRCGTCGGMTITRNADEGTTPFMILCTRPGCGGRAFSEFYHMDPRSMPTHEWHRPTPEEFKRLDKATRDYCAAGAMLLRPIRPEEAERARIG